MVCLIFLMACGPKKTGESSESVDELTNTESAVMMEIKNLVEL